MPKVESLCYIKYLMHIISFALQSTLESFVLRKKISEIYSSMFYSGKMEKPVRRLLNS